MLAAGTTLGPYQIIASLGTGGMGEVYRAHDGRLGRDVAIKLLLEDLAATSGPPCPVPVRENADGRPEAL